MKAKRLLFLLSLILFCLLTAANGKSSSQKRFTVLGLGDSITEGGGESFPSYLYPLWEKLYTGGYLVDFIGPNAQQCRIGELNHAGYSGKTVEFLETSIDSIYLNYPADIVLLHAGHNHFAEEKPVPGMIAAYQSIIGKIKKINPDVTVLIAQVIHSGKLPKYSYIPELNMEIAWMVGKMNDPRVILVNQASGFAWEEHAIEDKVHPNQQGAEQMAEVWYKALKDLLPTPEQSFHPEIVTYKVIGNHTLKMHIFTPEQRDPESRSPAIVHFFGGGWKLGTPLQFYRECAYYASKGMVAVTVDYRISFLHGSTPEESLEDAEDAICWLRALADEWNIDISRIAASGASAGGYLAAAAGVSNPATYPCATPDLLLLNYAAISRLGELREQLPPILFLVGSEDPIVPLSLVSDFEKKVQQKNGEFELHIFEGAGHPIFQYRKDLDDTFYKVRQLTDSFLAKHGYIK